jgi:hypothetical protein
MKTNLTTYKKLLMTSLLLISAFLISCGQSKIANTTDSSYSSTFSSYSSTLEEAVARGLPVGSSTNTTAYCNQKVGTNATINLMSFVGPSGSTVMRYMRAKIPSLTYGVDDSTVSIKFFRWGASGTGTTSPVPVNFQFTDNSKLLLVGGNNGTTSGQSFSVLSTANVKDFLSKNGLTVTSLSDVVNHANFLIDLVDSSSAVKALKMAIYVNGTVAEEIDLLLPSFAADPVVYASDSINHPPVLANLHPFASRSGQGMSAETLASEAIGFCF